MADEELINYAPVSKEQKFVHYITACVSHSESLRKEGWEITSQWRHGRWPCAICKEGYKRAIKYALTGWYE